MVRPQQPILCRRESWVTCGILVRPICGAFTRRLQAFQCQAVPYSSLQCVHPYVRSEEPSLRSDHDPGQTPAGAEVKDGRQATAAGGASLRSAPAGVTLGWLGGGPLERTGLRVASRLVQGGALASGGSAANHAIRQPCMRSGAGRGP